MGNAAAGRDADAGPPQWNCQVFNDVPEPVGDIHSPAELGLRHDQDKFISSVADEIITFSDRRQDSSGYGLQNVISGLMPVVVIDFFEVVQVKHDRPQVA